jgi:CHAT domain-containing protein/tetratricopeptide (TPR) repeat protein
MEVQKLLIPAIKFSFIGVVVFFTGCVAIPLKTDLAKDTNIKFIRTYQEITAEKWKKTEIMVQKGETVVIVPLYPKGFIHSVQGKVGDTGKPFEGLDVDLGDIYTAQTDGVLHLGMDQKADSVDTGIFVFKTSDSDNILLDLRYIQKNNKDAKMINVTLGLLLKKRADRLLAENKQADALPVFDQSIGYLEQADEKLYSRTIYQLYREKAVIYKSRQDQINYSDSIYKSFAALIRASEYYSELAKPRFEFMKHLTSEEKFILITQTDFFQNNQDFDQWASRPSVISSVWGDMPGFANLAFAYMALCKHYILNGNLELSLTYGEKGIEEAKKTGSRDLLGLAYRELGVRHASFGLNQEAEENYKLALDHMSKYISYYILPTASMAILEADQGKFDIAENRLKERATFDVAFKALKELALARVYSKKQDHDSVIKMGNTYLSNSIRKKIILGLAGKYKESNSADFMWMLDSYVAKGNAEQTDMVFSFARECLDIIGSPINLKLRYSLALSKLNKRFGKDEIAPLQDAIASLEAIRPTATSGKDYEYWENMLKVYDMTVASLYSKGKYLDALNTVEKARSRRFLDDLGNKKLGAKGVASLMTQRANETLDALAMLEQDMMEAAQKAGIKVRSVYDKESRLGKKVDNYKATLKQASDADHQFGVVTNIVPVSAEKLQKHIPPDTTVVEYYQSEDTLYAWVIDNKNITAVKQELSKDKLRKLIEQYRKSLYLDTEKRGIAILEKETGNFAALQREAYKLLITPVEKLIKTKKICIVPYDILNYLPFQSLQDGKQYLIEKYAVSYLPSLSVLEYLRKTQKKDSYKILAIGNPDLNDAKKDLPAAEKEVDMIRDVFPNTAVFKRDKATAALVKRMAPMYDIVHFAAHGEYNAADPLSSCLYLASGEGEDGQLQVKEIFDMIINADMVVTSACQTAMGKIGRGDEVLGLTRAFIYAGANSVLGSLWSISDEATSVLMKEFYTNIKTMEMTEALRLAQLKMIQTQEYSHPFYWAAFNITGAL